MQMEFQWLATGQEMKAPWFSTAQTRQVEGLGDEILWARSMANVIELNLPEVIEDARRGDEDPYMQNLAEWQVLTRLASELKDREMELRKDLFAGAFPTPTEGSNKHTLPDGRIVKGTYKISRMVDQASVVSVQRKLREDLGTKADDLFPTKFGLDKKVLDSLTDEQKAIAADAYTEKPGAPALEII
jgi:hypothetical protein